MATDQTPQTAGFAEVSRTLVAIAAEVVTGVQRAVVGPDNMRTAQDNAWSAIQADRALAVARAETSRAAAAIVATRPQRPARRSTRTVAARVR
ncbi:hypothetical protein [Actinoplanes regularis]|uniref:Uncharacterized protein n=1 Tax=Actinoplanes regularis TaxID=52697 RepID=A0A238WFC8_9ACTN|nr:hypothetical protein [Actinoplanes regularis]GIE84963.1 hypothetical protein Are01nite_14430 [Actinoplanes regularis]GLW27151.1 hypothetical protein Areg01_00920 [Actinoplanes regularis]SNR44964.1 hypothetical protein SAMN06264365_102464 [Actinoplanes regularis]